MLVKLLLWPPTNYFYIMIYDFNKIYHILKQYNIRGHYSYIIQRIIENKIKYIILGYMSNICDLLSFIDLMWYIHYKLVEIYK